MTETPIDLAAFEAERARLRETYQSAQRPVSSARGIHHTALISSDVERTIGFYQGILEFPLTEVFTGTEFSARAGMIVNFYGTFLNQIERERWISNMVNGIALLQMDTSDHLGHVDVEQANIPGKQ